MSYIFCLGKGVYIGNDGSQYDGEWRKNMRHGKGSQIGTDGCIYNGDFWMNMKVWLFLAIDKNHL